jgi:hypothetical protein
MAAYVGHYIDRAKVERRLSVAVVRRIYDDLNLGVAFSEADAEGGPDSPLAQLIVDSESEFEGYCRGIYDLTALRAAKPPGAVRLCLDLAEAFAALRFPRAMNRDAMLLEQRVTAKLKALRRAEVRLDVPDLEPANIGGEILNGTSAEVLDPFEPTYLNGFGSY